MRELLQLIGIQFKESFREPASLFWSFAFPILMAWGLGIAFSSNREIVRNVAVVLDKNQNNSEIKKLLTNNLTTLEFKGKVYRRTVENKQLGRITFKFIPSSWDSAVIMLKRGQISLMLTEVGGKLHYHFDPANSDAQLTYLQLASLAKGQALATNPDEIKPLTQIGTRYIDFFVPGLITMGIMSSCLWGISYSLIEKRSKKLLRRMVATPMKKTNFLIAQIISRLTLSFFESAVLVLFAYFYFHIQIQGSIWALIAAFISGNFAFIGIAILISSHTANTQIGNGLINVVTMPMMVLSGVFFSYQNFPAWTIPYIKVLPLTMFTDSLRSIFIEGAGLMQTLFPISMLFATGFLCFFVGLKIYKWY
ncbi:MAG: ABC transporter permease [Bacteroidota bacterium]|nr:ABC transporter permease [Bacteroidota bacterium]